MTTFVTPSRYVAVLASAALTLSACGGGDSSPKTLSANEVAAQIHTSWVGRFGNTVHKIVCPLDLQGVAGASEVCVVTAIDGSAIQVTATVEESGGSYRLFMKVADKELNGPTATATPTK